MPTPQTAPLRGNLDDAILLLPSAYAWPSTNLTYHFATSLPSGYANQWTGLYTATGSRLNYTAGAFEPWAADQRTDALRSLNELNSFTNLSFTQGSAGSATMSFGALSTNAYRTSAGSGGDGQAGTGYYPNDLQPYRGDVWLFGDINDSPTTVPATYWQQVIPHEIGHAMGLRHPHEVGLSGLLSNYSVMSYTPTLQENLFTREYQLYDIAALQYRYGFDAATGDGNQTYSTHDETLPGEATARARYYSIWDESGLDTLTAGNSGTSSAYIDLRPGHFSSVGANSGVTIQNGSITDYGKQNVSIAFGTIIDDAVGSANADVIIGNALSNVLQGGAGDDVIYADGWNISYDEADYIRVTKGAFLHLDYDPFAQTDDLYGDAGNDTLFGSSGSDWMYGGADFDTASYARELEAVTMRYDGIALPVFIDVFGPSANNDRLFEIEKVVLTDGDDRLEVVGRVLSNITVDGAAGVDDAVDGDPGTSGLIIFTDASGNGYIRNAGEVGGFQITLQNFRPNINTTGSASSGDIGTTSSASSGDIGSAFGGEINDQSSYRNLVRERHDDVQVWTVDQARTGRSGDDPIDLILLDQGDRGGVTTAPGRNFVENDDNGIATSFRGEGVFVGDMIFDDVVPRNGMSANPMDYMIIA